MAGTLSRFLGGSPIRVFIRLAILSIALGFVMHWTGFTPQDIFYWVIDLAQRAYDLGFEFFADAFYYFLLGAAIVVPVFLVLRLLRFGRSHDE